MTPATEQQREQLLNLRRRLVQIAAPIGSMHSYWDDISEIDERLNGGRGMLQQFNNAQFAQMIDARLAADAKPQAAA